MIKTVHIFDLDGCVIDSLHRYRATNGRIDIDYWRRNCTRENILKDTLLPLADHYKLCVEDKEAYVIIATSRQAINHDLYYINKHLAGYDKLIYRQLGDETKGYLLKTKPIKPILRKFKEALIYVYEDNLLQMQEICRIFNNMGMNTIGLHTPSKQGH